MAEGQIRSGRTGSEVERVKGVGSGKVLEPGIELGTPVAQQRCMSAHCPQGYRRRPVRGRQCVFSENLVTLMESGKRNRPGTDVSAQHDSCMSAYKNNPTKHSTFFPIAVEKVEHKSPDLVTHVWIMSSPGSRKMETLTGLN
ncbi:hypothetical protein Q8A67_016492 [Cirrhinus molitorella]|uniref:Uncharacterized protein n=1 Tax=Cirrhinus molitorella TaxID=172907 RepID=A0AA88PK66_9TELE|nr:hypothetical protein Q8A67_016492 [Cirrhinus molitorella]